MALNIKNAEVERLVSEVADLAGESKTEAVRRALEERRSRLALLVAPKDRRAAMREFLEHEIWADIPRRLLGRRLTRREKDDILGYGPEGV